MRGLIKAHRNGSTRSLGALDFPRRFDETARKNPF